MTRNAWGLDSRKSFANTNRSVYRTYETAHHHHLILKVASSRTLWWPIRIVKFNVRHTVCICMPLPYLWFLNVLRHSHSYLDLTQPITCHLFFFRQESPVFESNFAEMWTVFLLAIPCRWYCSLVSFIGNIVSFPGTPEHACFIAACQKLLPRARRFVLTILCRPCSRYIVWLLTY